MKPSLVTILLALYDSEINCRIGCFWDGGWDVWLGDELNGWKEKTSFNPFDEDAIAEWLTEAAKRHFPDSVFAKYW